VPDDLKVQLDEQQLRLWPLPAPWSHCSPLSTTPLPQLPPLAAFVVALAVLPVDTFPAASRAHTR
jgi:hypothetical protein